MDKQELLDALENSRDRMLAVLEGLPDEAWLEPGVVGEWSVKDTLADLSRWEAELIGLLYQAQQGRRPVSAHFSSASADKLNAQWHAEGKDRPLNRILADFEGVREQTIRRVQTFESHDLTDPKRFPWLRSKTLADWIATDSFEHEAEHMAQISAWRKARGI